MQDPHLIALDLDGTVVSHGPGGLGDDADGGHIDDDLIEAIRALDAAGHYVIVATGRVPYLARNRSYVAR